jgi:hypothetical protein
MTNGRQEDAAAFLTNIAQTAHGLSLSGSFASEIPNVLAYSARVGFFPQNVIATEFTTGLVCFAILQILQGRADDLLAPRVLNFDPFNLMEQTPRS